MCKSLHGKKEFITATTKGFHFVSAFHLTALVYTSENEWKPTKMFPYIRIWSFLNLFSYSVQCSCVRLKNSELFSVHEYYKLLSSKFQWWTIHQSAARLAAVDRARPRRGESRPAGQRRRGLPPGAQHVDNLRHGGSPLGALLDAEQRRAGAPPHLPLLRQRAPPRREREAARQRPPRNDAACSGGSTSSFSLRATRAPQHHDLTHAWYM